LSAPGWLWIALTLGAALAQTFRNATQRNLIASLGTLGATLVRFLYGLPFAAAWLLAVATVGEHAWPALDARFVAWVTAAALTQLVATVFLLKVMHQRNFALGIAYSKTDAMLAALFALAILGETISNGVAIAVATGTLGVMLLSPADPAHPLRALITGWTTRSALFGIACGANFAISGVCLRAAALSLPEVHFAMSAAIILFGAQFIQTVTLGSWLLAREPAVFTSIERAICPFFCASCRRLGVAFSVRSAAEDTR